MNLSNMPKPRKEKTQLFPLTLHTVKMPVCGVVVHDTFGALQLKLVRDRPWLC